MNNFKKISEWEYILLDTSFIIDFLTEPDRLDKNPKKKENSIMAKDIMKCLSLDTRKIKPQFYITTVTIGELKFLTAKSVAKKLLELFSCGDVTILPYGRNEAELLNTITYNLNSKQNINIAKKIKEQCALHKCANIRSWISDDEKILSCALYQFEHNRLDVILTSDEHTFKPIADFLELPCITLDKRNFCTNLWGELDV